MENKSFIEVILSSDKNLIRSLAFFSVIGIILAILVKIIISSFFKCGELSVEMNQEGRIIYKYAQFNKDSDMSFSTFLLPSNECWYDTGIDLDEDQKIKIVLSGRSHLAIHKLVESADNDKKSKVNWSGPEGSDIVDLGESPAQKIAKRKLLIKPGETIGNVILYFCPIGNTHSFKNDFIKNRHSYDKNTIPVINNEEYPNPVKGKVRLFLTVNDVLFDFVNVEDKKYSEIAYSRKDKPEKFSEIKDNEFHDVWFADNIGSFLVNVEISQAN